ncbi:MAG: carbohydrate binding family 9 domain-containing protein, partial [candidate division Zixibacteria bacterium]|nr:carbohydrate binding family 9 domain-containing protein [candidate division Zixibacteria bacterium]
MFKSDKFNLKTVMLLLVISFVLNPHYVASKEFEPVYKPTLKTSKITASIKIDGLLDEEVWKTLMKADNFVERYPGDNLEPEVKTYAYITYDDDNLYIGFKCFDDPAKIRATMCERDQFWNDDAVAVLIDTYANAAWAYEFYVNPYGVQKDILWSSVTGEDSGYDLIWESAAKITSDGYEVEMAIPFSSMRFPSKDVQEWKVDFWRNHPRETFKTYSWSANNRDEQCFPCQWGTVEGISEVSPSKGLEILPTIVASQSGEIDYSSSDLNLKNDKLNSQLSLGAKYSLTDDVTLEAAYNPDFSQIEADAAQIDVNTTIALFFPERRPFFQEGRDIFQTLFNSFYTRTVNNPEYAAKLISRKEKTRIGFLTAKDETSPYTIPLEEGTIIFDIGPSYINVLRGTHNIGGNNEIGIMLSDRRFENGGSGSILAFDHSLRLSTKFTLIGQYVLSHTKEPDKLGKTAFLDGVSYDHGKFDLGFNGESYYGNAFITQFRGNGRNYHFTFNIDQVSPSYRTQAGFDPVNNDRNFMFNGSYTFRFPETSFLERIS